MTHDGICQPLPDLNFCDYQGEDNRTLPAPPVGPDITYAKRFTEWSTCSATCGGGTQTRTFICEDAAGEIVGAKPSLSTLYILAEHSANRLEKSTLT
jgi:hypothetical protein